MNHKLFLSQLSQDEILNLSTEEIQQRILAEQEFINKQPHKNFLAATHGSKTKNGGLVKASALQSRIGGLPIALVGDDVIYADGTISKIISGAGKGCLINGQSAALVGSSLENGDEIVDSPNISVAINIFIGDKTPEGFLCQEGVNHG